MPIVTDSEGIRDILTRYRRIAVVGLSNNPDRPSNEVSRFMQAQGYEIYPGQPDCCRAGGAGAHSLRLAGRSAGAPGDRERLSAI